MKHASTLTKSWTVRDPTVALSTLLLASVASATPYPEGFDPRSGGVAVSVVRLDNRGTGESFVKQRDGLLAVWRARVETATAGGPPAPPMPTFQPGYDQPSRTHTARFIRLDRTADVRLTTFQAYGCKGGKTDTDPVACGPLTQRTVVLFKLINGRRHIWKAELDTGKGTHQIDPRNNERRLSHLTEEDAVRMNIGEPQGYAQHLGYRCRIRLIGENRVCNYVEQGGTPSALHHVVAWNEHVSDPRRYFRLDHLNVADTLNVSYFEPPENIRFVEVNTGPVQSSESEEDDEEQTPPTRNRGRRQ
jgi:hypothetical protein